MKENSLFEKKSLRIVSGDKPKWKELAKDCVCFANGVGGKILIGIEDNKDLPDENQKVENVLIEKIRKRINSLTINVAINVKKQIAKNGGEYIELIVLMSKNSVASTSDGKYYIRVSDNCNPVLPDAIQRLVAEKEGFVWETKVVDRIDYRLCDKGKLEQFILDVNESVRVSDFVSGKSTEEKLEYYFLIKDGYLTNLGRLWIGTREQRATLHFPPAIQFIKYDELENKVKKIVWDDYLLNPKELLDKVVNSIPEWKESVEISEGIFRKQIYNYDPEVVRELVANALVHRSYSIQGDIFINLFIDRLEIHSPGLLPLGVTPQNILTQSVQRNHLLAKLFWDLGLMEKEGSGYDKVYEILLSNGKKPPIVNEIDDRVTVTIYKRFISKEVVKVMNKASEEFLLTQKETITLGLIAQNNGINAIELSNMLNVNKPNGLRHWIGRLLDFELIISKGKTKGMFYEVNPKFLKQADFIAKTTLKKIEPYRLKALILEDLGKYPGSSVSEIHQRIGKEINLRTLRNMLQKLLSSNEIGKKGEKRGRRYFIDKKL